MTDKEVPLITVNDLPMTFKIKYLGNCPARGLWGIKHTRKPVDHLVSMAKNLRPGEILPLVDVVVSQNGFSFTQKSNKKSPSETTSFTVDVISYGVQDLVYTRVFSMIIVVDETLKSANPFICHSFVCDSRDQARKITYALAATFQDYGRKVKEASIESGKPMKRLAIDLRTPEEQAEDSDGETDA
ncbi:uncharacterized protein LOC132707439 [Cylas formicarius]|uniref:uncharacterized protein LOC132707439 n=1 Tax=Cylas formicarius TaxID=197179 RepID=UPI0029588E2E|nr:uncharacterized protein LOC132707439 [Cylas formicarius]